MRKIRKGSFARKVLRAFGKYSGFESPLTSEEKRLSGKVTLAERLQLMKPHGNLQGSVSLQEENVGSGSFREDYHDYEIEIRNALLEAECKKAMGISAWEKQRRMY